MVLAQFISINNNFMVIKDNFMMVINMEMVTKYSKMVINTQVHTLKISSMVKVNINGKTEPNTKELFIKAKNMDKAF